MVKTCQIRILTGLFAACIVKQGLLVQVSGELFTLSYGALVAQLLKDYDSIDAVNRQLDKIGYNMGLRMIDDFLAKNPMVGKCVDLREIADVIAKQGFKLYLGRVLSHVAMWPN